MLVTMTPFRSEPYFCVSQFNPRSCLGRNATCVRWSWIEKLAQIPNSALLACL